MSDGSVKTSLQPGYILHYREFQESSFIVDAFTLTHGRIALIAKSARNSRPQIRALYQPFRPLLLSWVGAGELRTLTGIEEAGEPLGLRNRRLACGYYVNELVLRLLGKDQPQDKVFAYYSLALAELQQPELDYERILRIFELQLLDVLGVLPDLLYCTPDGSTIVAEREYLYHPANAIAVPVRSGDDGLGLLKAKHRVDDRGSGLQGSEHYGGSVAVHPDGMTPDGGIPVHGSTLMALNDLDLSDDAVLRESRKLMRSILRVQLGDRPLKSREMFQMYAGGEARS